MDQEEQWIEDGNETAQVDDEDELAGSDLFADPRGEFQLTFENGISVSVTGIKAKYPMFLQSTGLTLWKSSKTLCSHLCSNSNIVRDKSVIELGAGLGLAGIVAQKLGAQKVVLTDGDTDTLDNMRENISTNIETHDGEENDSIICKQLLWGRNVEDFREKWAPPEGFDVVMGSDIIYAKEYVKDLFKTVSTLLSTAPGSIFIVSHMKRNPTLSFDYVFTCAEEIGFQWTAPEGDTEEGIYTFYR